VLFTIILDRIQPVLNDVNPTHVSLEAMNNCTLITLFEVIGYDKVEIEEPKIIV